MRIMRTIMLITAIIITVIMPMRIAMSVNTTGTDIRTITTTRTKHPPGVTPTRLNRRS